jgi:hypothetical protein
VNIVRNILAAIGAIAVLLFVFRIVTPLARPSESITQGSYRGLSIGTDKTGAVREILKRNRLELTGFEGVDGEFESAYFDAMATRQSCQMFGTSKLRGFIVKTWN